MRGAAIKSEFVRLCLPHRPGASANLNGQIPAFSAVHFRALSLWPLLLCSPQVAVSGPGRRRRRRTRTKQLQRCASPATAPFRSTNNCFRHTRTRVSAPEREQDQPTNATASPCRRHLAERSASQPRPRQPARRDRARTQRWSDGRDEQHAVRAGGAAAATQGGGGRRTEAAPRAAGGDWE